MAEVREKIAFCGTRGIPANYGGFETAVDEISKRFVKKGYQCDVFCRLSSTNYLVNSFGGRTLIYVKGSKKRKFDTFLSSIQTGIYLMKHRHDYDYIFWFNNANVFGILLTLLTRIPFSVNSDGLEWRRTKWSFPFKTFYFLSSFLISRLCSSIISDSVAIQKYYKKIFFKKTKFIPYGVPQRIEVNSNSQIEILRKYGIQRDRYFLQITRFEPDNLPLEIAQQFRNSNWLNKKYKILFIGYKDDTPYAVKLKELSGQNGIEVHNAVYDQKVLTVLRENAFCYIHGNSVGGTNPALLEAMNTCKRVMAIDVEFSHEVLGENGVFFNVEDMSGSFKRVTSLKNESISMRNRIKNKYNWDDVASQYMEFLKSK